jgi:hypothetical protein
MADTIKYRFRCRRRTAANWITLNEVLLPQEIGLESDTGLGKVGDDAGTPWNDLLYTIVGQVDLDGLSDGKCLAWDSSSGRWVVANRGAVYIAGAGIDINSTDPEAPIISSTLGSIALAGRVATYGALPSSGNVAGDAYLVDADGLTYIWNGTTFPANGTGISTSLSERILAKWDFATNGVMTVPLEADLTGVSEFRLLVQAATSVSSAYRGLQTSNDFGATWKTSNYQFVGYPGVIAASSLTHLAMHGTAASAAVYCYAEAIVPKKAPSTVRTAQEIGTSGVMFILPVQTPPINRIRFSNLTPSGVWSNLNGGTVTILGK